MLLSASSEVSAPLEVRDLNMQTRRSHTVLLLAHAYPPYPASGALRPEKIVRALRNRGHSVVVVTSKLASDRGATRVREPGLEVLPVRFLPNPRHLYVSVKATAERMIRRGGHPDPRATPPSNAVPESFATWKRYLLSFLLLPDDQQGFIPSAVVRALPIIIRHGVDLLYTTGPVFSTHVAGLVLKRLTRVRWAAEFRDLWTQDPDRERMRHLQCQASVAIERWLERRFLLEADHVVAVSRGIMRHLMQRVNPAHHDRFILARNGITKLATHPTAPTSHQMRALYLGSLGMQRDPRPFLRAVAALRERGFLTRYQLTIDFVGNCDWYQDVPMRPFVASLGLSDVVRIRGWIPYQQGQQMVDEADLLLLFAQAQPDAVPNKLYEYLGTRRPILAFADDTGENAYLLRKAGGHHVITEHDGQPAIERAITAVIQDRANGTRPHGDDTVLREWTTEHQMAQLLDALGC